MEKCRMLVLQCSVTDKLNRMRGVKGHEYIYMGNRKKYATLFETK